jgi:hypothetical protein
LIFSSKKQKAQASSLSTEGESAEPWNPEFSRILLHFTEFRSKLDENDSYQIMPTFLASNDKRQTFLD